jgi:hypothetical protein
MCREINPLSLPPMHPAVPSTHASSSPFHLFWIPPPSPRKSHIQLKMSGVFKYSRYLTNTRSSTKSRLEDLFRCREGVVAETWGLCSASICTFWDGGDTPQGRQSAPGGTEGEGAIWGTN